MATYIIIFLVFSVFALSAVQEQRRGTILIALLFLLWFMGWRDNVGCDFTGYLNRFRQIPPWSSLLDALTQVEPGFQLLETLIVVSGLKYLWLNVAASLIMLLCYFRYFYVSRRPLTELTLLFPIVIVQLSMSGIRQGIAVAMLTAACAEFIKGRRAGTALWIILAAQFHTSAAVFLPLALLAGRSISLSRLIAAVVVLMPAAAYLMGSRFDDYTDQYVQQIYGESSSQGALLRYILALLPAIYFWKFRSRFSQVMPEWQSLFQVFSLAIFFTAPLFFVSSLIVHRMTLYLIPISIAIAANAYRVSRDGQGAGLIQVAPILIYGVYFLGWLYTSAHARSCYIPYNNYTLGIS